MSPAILERAQQLIEARGFSGLSALVESLIREEWERRGGEARVPQSRPKLKITGLDNVESKTTTVTNAFGKAAAMARVRAIVAKHAGASPTLRRRRSRSLPNIPATGTPITPIDTSEP